MAPWVLTMAERFDTFDIVCLYVLVAALIVVCAMVYGCCAPGGRG